MKKIITLCMLIIFLFTLAACSSGAGDLSVVEVSEVQNVTAASPETGSASSAVTAGPDSVAAALAENSTVHEDATDYVWENAAEVPIVLNGSAITANGEGVSMAGSTATITAAGVYRLSGSLADGQIIVNTTGKEVVRLILDGVDLRSTTSAPLYIQAAEEVVIVLAENSQNALTDGESYVFASAEEDEPNAALFSTADLTIYGTGALTVNGNYNDGIASKDGLLITSGKITVNAVDDGIRGKDYLVVKDGTLAVTAGGDGLKSDNEEEADRGYIAIEAGSITVTAGGDAIQAQTDVMISGGEFDLTAGGGSTAQVAETESAKGIKATVTVNIDGGTFTLDTADDALHSNGSLTVNGGAFQIASGDDGIHADTSLTINAGDIQITRSYEGLESAVITLNAGNINVVASDDGINIAGGMDRSGMNPGGRMMPGGQGQDSFAYAGSYYLYIHGGYIVVEAAGDGLDVNGAIEMTGGTVLVNGPTEQMNGALDYDGSFNLSGGFFVAAGSSGMAQAPGTSSSQATVLIYLNGAQPGGTLVHIQDSSGKEILTFAPTKAYQSVAFSSPNLVQGETYTVYLGGNTSALAQDGLYEAGAYTAGSQVASFTVSGGATMVGSGSGFGPGGGAPGGGRPRRP